jgi:hypothetical protein
MHFFHDPAIHVASQIIAAFTMSFCDTFQLGTEAEAPLPDACGRQMWHREARW